ncbi:MAG TPA: [acyl-carrier-protein] S-malonyltransferase [Nitrospirae bacterium]|nr:[acyl-carrier-protein] S-malonyltransferase [Nitrospirota bacterium]
MSTAFIFPGQGSQYVGMGKAVHDEYREAREVFEEASERLGYDVADLCFNGPKEELNRTYRTQPCLLTASIAAYRVLASKGLGPSVVAGHSLGEYSALVAAGVMEFGDAVVLTEKRGRFMQSAVPESAGLMAAILGLQREQVDEVCLSVTSGYVSPANYNCPGQIVIAGWREAVEEAMSLAKEAGAKRVLPLAVSAPSHCALMIEASKKLAEELRNIDFTPPRVPVVNNADAMYLNTVDSIKASLVKQLDSPLLWEDSVRNMTDSGVDAFVEVGPGKVLSGLIKRIAPDAATFHTDAGIEEVVRELKGRS